MGFRTYTDIEDFRIDESQYLKTGIEKLDKAILGLGLGQLVIITGTRAGGKTTLTGQLTCNFIDKGYSGLICSFEMANPRLKNWLTLQALGSENLRGYTTSTGKELFYPRTKEVKKAVDDWISSKLKVYDNAIFDAEKICSDISEEIKKNPKIKFVILDNLMKIELDGMRESKWEAQSQIVKKLQHYAQRKNICIILVAHPNKVKTLPRIEDVDGRHGVACPSGNGGFQNPCRRVLRLERRKSRAGILKHYRNRKRPRVRRRRQYGRGIFRPEIQAFFE